ncbi:MAG TPA: lysylphosphatidylglycerol synthase domain-containing protein [Nocardioides sp.]|nr:lysylphosphatidylglycerol synthase domain-containing protein [Nocardioides sp.]
MTTILAPATGVSRRAQSALLNHRWSLQVVGGLVVIGLLVWQLGTGPFLDGLLATRPWAVLVALVATAGTTWCCAVRWSLVSGRFGERVPVRTAYVAYYRSQLINTTVPGGVVGDVHRGARHGWRGVLWERGLGQVVQVALVGSLLLPGPWRWLALAALAVALVAGGAVLVLSALAVAGHLAIFLAAAASVGVALTPLQLLPIGALVLLGAAVPLNVAGWGPREGVAAWAFAAYGSTASVGLAVSVTFGVLAMVATLPGLLIFGSRHG